MTPLKFFGGKYRALGMEKGTNDSLKFMVGGVCITVETNLYFYWLTRSSGPSPHRALYEAVILP